VHVPAPDIPHKHRPPHVSFLLPHSPLPLQPLQAYYILSHGDDESSSPGMDDAFMCDALAADFFEEAYRQEVPAFEMMFMHEQLASSGSGQSSSSSSDESTASVWSAADREARSDSMWRQIHRSLRRRRQGGV
jgi:hypothetical protein